MSHRSSISSSKPPAPGLVRAALIALPRAPGGGGDRRLLLVVLAGLVALPLASRPLATWAASLSDWAQPARDGLVWWDAAMDRAGLTAPYDDLHRWVRDWVARPF